jgi:predicted DCC family thiol-disulfide oxidoreductase YuxK
MRCLHHCDIVYSLKYSCSCDYFSKSQEILSELGLDEDSFHSRRDQTIFLITPFGEILTESDALLAVLQVLPGARFSVLRFMLKAVPRFGRDYLYGYVARNRHTLLNGGEVAATSTPSSEGGGGGEEGGGEEGGGGGSCTLLATRTPAEQARFL